MKKYIIILSLILISGCAKTAEEKYLDLTSGQSHEDWAGSYVWHRVYAGIVLNAIPGFHIAGLIIDTFYVYIGIDDLILGNGAIIARQRGCSGLVSDDDYDLFFAWEGGERQLVMSAFQDAFDKKKETIDLTSDAANRALQNLSEPEIKSQKSIGNSKYRIPVVKPKLSNETIRAITPAARKVIEKKIGEKIAAKIGSKIAAKVVAKAVVGFIPFVGAGVAGFVNWWILDDIDDDSREYFREKARIVCS